MRTASPLTATFRAARAEGRAALVGYLPAGYPSVDGAVSALRAMVAAGVDIVEVGLPYSDPLMDGPTIQRAVDAALRAGTTTADVLRTVESVAATGAPTVVMSYWNPVDHYGVDRFARDLATAGGVGVITPDLIPDEADEWSSAARAQDIDTVFLVAPSSSDERIKLTVGGMPGLRVRGVDHGSHRRPRQRQHGSGDARVAHPGRHRPAGRRRTRCLDRRAGR